MNLEDLIRRGVMEATAQIVEEEAEKAARRVQTRVRERVTAIAAQVCQRMAMEPYGKDSLKIIVSFEDSHG